jgi:hypothetical protein
MLFLVLVAMLVGFLAVLAFSKRFAFHRVTLFLAVVLGMAGSTAGGGLFASPESSTYLRLVTLDETAQAHLPKHAVAAALGLTAAGYRAKSISILVRRNDLAELREQIKYEHRRGNITAEGASSLSVLIDEINLEGNVAVVNAPDRRVVALNTAKALADLAQSQARLNETLADTIKLVTVLDSLRSPEFAGTFIAAKIQVVRLLAEKAAVDSSIDEIRQIVKRPKAG